VLRCSACYVAYLEDWEQGRTPTASDKDDACGEDGGGSEYTILSAAVLVEARQHRVTLDDHMRNLKWKVDIPEVIVPVLRSHDLILEDGIDARWCLLTSGSEVGRSDFLRLRHCCCCMVDGYGAQ